MKLKAFWRENNTLLTVLLILLALGDRKSVV